MEVPRGEKHPRFSRLPEIDSFVKTDRERKLLSMFRLFRFSGSPLFSPGMQKDAPDHQRSNPQEL